MFEQTKFLFEKELQSQIWLNTAEPSHVPGTSMSLCESCRVLMVGIVSPPFSEPGELLSMGSHRVGHDWSDLAATSLSKRRRRRRRKHLGKGYSTNVVQLGSYPHPCDFLSPSFQLWQMLSDQEAAKTKQNKTTKHVSVCLQETLLNTRKQKDWRQKEVLITFPGIHRLYFLALT